MSMTRVVATTGLLLIGIGAAAGQAPIRPAVLITELRPTSVPGSPRSPAAVIDRLASFDANKDHLISRDELPERMQGLVARGDKNADGTLDSDEIRALVSAASSERSRRVFRTQPSEGLPGVISDLKLAPVKHVRALAIVLAHQLPPNAKEWPGSELQKEMRALLDSEEYENFAAATARLSRNPQFVTVSGTVDGMVLRSGGR